MHQARDKNRDDTIRLIFILGQAQALILPELLKIHAKGNVYIFSPYEINEFANTKYINIKPKSAAEYAKLIFQIFRLTAKIRKAAELFIYTPHLMNYLANKFYFANKDKIKLYYLFDGTLNYRPVSANEEPALSYQNRQKIKSLAVFHKYVFLRNQIVDTKLRGAQAFIGPNGMIESRLLCDLPIHKINIELGDYTPKRKILLLEPILPSDKLIEFENWARKVISDNLSNYQLIIKPHPSAPASLLNTNKLSDCCTDVIVLSEKSPAELIFSREGCSVVLSTLSSATLMIKTAFPLAQAYITTQTQIETDGNLHIIKLIMKEAGVNIS